MGSRLLAILPAGSRSTHTQLPLEVRPYASQWGSLWPLRLLFRQLLGLQRLGCSKHPTWSCLGPSKIKIIWRTVLELFCNCFPDVCNFCATARFFFFFLWGFHGHLLVRGMEKGWQSLLPFAASQRKCWLRCEPGCLGRSSWKTSLWDYCSSVSASKARVLHANRIQGNLAWLSLSSFFLGTGDHPARPWQLVQLRKGQVKPEKDK